jgi:hypothetical protein
MLILLRNYICMTLLAGQVLARDAQVIERQEGAQNGKIKGRNSTNQKGIPQKVYSR